METSSGRTETVGADRVVYKAGAVVIHAAREMADWRVSRYRKTAVVLGGQTYFVASRMPLPDGAWRYALTPWPEDDHDQPGNVVHYDETYVLEREAVAHAQRRVDRTAVGLFAASLLLGFLFSPTKLRLNERYAIHPAVVTRRSLLLEYLALICVLSLLVIGGAAAGLAPAFGVAPRDVLAGGLEPLRLAVVAAVLAADAVVRKARLDAGGMRQYGFGEWMFRRLRGDD